MRLRRIIPALPLLALLCSCQKEALQEEPVRGRRITVRAALPGNDATRGYISFGRPGCPTRAQITYGNQDPDKEIFMWDMAGYGGLTQNDCVALFNVTRLSQWPVSGVQLDVTKIDGRTATFESVKEVNSKVEIKAGDLLFVNYGETGIRQISADGAYDPRKVFSFVVGTQANIPQYIVKNPNDSSLAYMHHNLRLYDIVKVEEDDSVPFLHFRHLSAIMRVTLRNETGRYFYPTQLQFDYPGTDSFFKAALYCGVDTTLASGLKIYTDDEIYNGSEVYTDCISTTINGKKGTADAGDSIAPGKTYELYLSTVPRIGNEQKGDRLIIDLIRKHDTDHPFRLTLDGFDVPIKAGQRYWFDLTAVTENDTVNKLMLTSEWRKLQTAQKPEEGGEESPAD